MVKVKIWAETTLSGGKRYINMLATVTRNKNGFYTIDSADGDYHSNTDKFNPSDRAFYTD